MPRKGLKYINLKEVAMLVGAERWDELHCRRIETNRGLVHNSAKMLAHYADIMECGKYPDELVKRVRHAQHWLLDNPTAGRKKADIQEGHTRPLRLNPKQGQALVPFCARFFGYGEGSGIDGTEKNPFKNQFITVTYKDNQIILTAMSQEEWSRVN
ncbi:hypothetical protein HN801_01455 [Candidatus Peregrinibacteria bacterium]|nr:hypothetical protein [Candidatus Peregrinibacteria bacterium]